MREFCAHYPKGGKAMNNACKKGVVFASLEMNSARDLPCWTNEADGCKLAEYPTPEQIAEREKWIANRLNGLGKFMAHETDMCFHCGKKVTSLRQVGRCVYGSCGCRLWQGKIPKEWEVAKAAGRTE